jgi:hypothetical protein
MILQNAAAAAEAKAAAVAVEAAAAAPAAAAAAAAAPEPTSLEQQQRDADQAARVATAAEVQRRYAAQQAEVAAIDDAALQAAFMHDVPDGKLADLMDSSAERDRRAEAAAVQEAEMMRRVQTLLDIKHQAVAAQAALHEQVEVAAADAALQAAESAEIERKLRAEHDALADAVNTMSNNSESKEASHRMTLRSHTAQDQKALDEQRQVRSNMARLISGSLKKTKEETTRLRAFKTQTRELLDKAFNHINCERYTAGTRTFTINERQSMRNATMRMVYTACNDQTCQEEGSEATASSGIQTALLAMSELGNGPEHTLSSAKRDEIARRPTDPKSRKEAMMSLARQQWTEAERKEIQNMIALEVWRIVPEDEAATVKAAEILTTLWQYKTKYNERNEPIKYKARLCVNGSRQGNVDSFAPTASAMATKLVATVAARQRGRGVRLFSADITAAFLNAFLKEKVYIRPNNVPGFSGKLLLLLRTMYGLKQAAREWSRRLHSVLTAQGWKQSAKDQCLYIRLQPAHKGSLSIEEAMVVHVDDMKIATTQRLFETFCAELTTKHGLGVTGGFTKEHVGIQIRQSDECIEMHQQAFLSNLLVNNDMENCVPAKLPSPYNLDKFVDDSPLLESMQKTKYKNNVGSLHWAAIWTRPDIQYAVTWLAAAGMAPQQSHQKAMTHILRYIKGTLNKCLRIACHNSTTPPPPLRKEMYVDASHASVRRIPTAPKSISVTGWVVLIDGFPLRWHCKRQHSNAAARKLAAATGMATDLNAHDDGKDPVKEDMIVHAISSAGAEYRAAVGGCVSGIARAQLLMDEFVTLRNDTPWTVYEDNQAVIKVAKNKDGNAKLTRHLAVRHNILHHMVQSGFVVLQYVSTGKQVADLFTKPNAPFFAQHREVILKSFLAKRYQARAPPDSILHLWMQAGASFAI